MPKTILLVEDEEILITILQKKLVSSGYEVVVARDGEAGLEEMKKRMPDLVLLDIIMPKIDGFEIMERMQKDDNLKKIPIFIISNSGQPVELDRARQLGAKGWLVKTDFDPQEVIDEVIKLIGK